ncbi:5-formyltetrahydrofolate cyclo-ligase [Tropicimonas sp. IMCC34011]|uniref:5-formyltetrahydrofolate cyclo-ligase n=1 Tax=Tropicimonas sp. IMCC34011 TaxID=2248759 RepID=UPI001E2C3A86|nr:5-formyltetrahydrofolate cyclo-ligase [Tropicimonas sp. IMCC34011]
MAALTKAEARARAGGARDAAHRSGAGPLVSAALVECLASEAGRVIAGYMPIRSEADPLPAMTALAARNRICVPVVVGPGEALRFREWVPGCALERGPFGVEVPAGGADLSPDLLIVPMLAFDARLYRLGYGGGFYDRTLEALRKTGAPEAVGLAYAAQELTELPLEPTDQPLDRLVTEQGARRPLP